MLCTSCCTARCFCADECMCTDYGPACFAQLLRLFAEHRSCPRAAAGADGRHLTAARCRYRAGGADIARRRCRRFASGRGGSGAS
jgi:hypothetical protein